MIIVEVNVIYSRCYGGGSGEGVFAMACTDQNITMISSHYNIITQYICLVKQCPQTTKLRRRKVMYIIISVYTDIAYNNNN